MDFVHGQKNNEEIIIAPVQENEFFSEQAKSLNEQRQRFEAAKQAKRDKKNGEAPGNGAAVADPREAILAGMNKAVQKNMPPKFAAHATENKVEELNRNQVENKAENKQQKKTALPEEMLQALNEIISWRKVKAETSIPVKKAAEDLKNAKTDAEASSAINTLAKACADYIKKNGGNIFKDSRRKEVVRTLIEKLSDFRNVLSQKLHPVQQEQEVKDNALMWEGKEVKESLFDELKLETMTKVMLKGSKAAAPEKVDEILGEENEPPLYENEAVLNAPEEGLTGEAAKKAALCRHLMAEKEKLALRRTDIRNHIKTLVDNKEIENISEMFHTGEEKEALREWLLLKGKKGEYNFAKGIYEKRGYLRLVRCVNVLETVQNASVDDFLDADDGEFASSFAEKYDRLCKYASAAVFLKIAEEAAAGTQMTDNHEFSLTEVKAKIRFFTEMKAQYEDRMRLMSSPYYITQKSEDMEKYLGKDGEKEKEKAADPKFKEYITLYQKVRESSLSIGKGKEAKGHYELILKNFQMEQLKKDEEKAKTALDRIRAGEEAEKVYYEEHEPDEIALKDDEQDEAARKLLKVWRQQKAFSFSSFPEDDLEFMKNIPIETGGEMVYGMEAPELMSKEKMIMEDIFLNGRIGGVEIETKLLSEVREMVRDFVSARREFMAECLASSFVGDIAEGLNLDHNNPLTKESDSYKALKGFFRGDGTPFFLMDSLALRRGEYQAKMSVIFGKLIGAGYQVFPEYQDRVEKEAAKDFSGDKQEKPKDSSTFTVNGKEYYILPTYTKGLLKNAAGLSFKVRGKEGERLIQLLDEQQKLLERTYYVAKNYNSEGGEKRLVANAYGQDLSLQLQMMQEKIANALGIMEEPLPESMTKLLDKALAWKKVSADTSIPIQNAVLDLKKAKTKTEVAEAMSTLALACTNYSEKNDGKMFKDSDRKKLVKNILDSVANYMAANDSSFYDAFSVDMAKVSYKSALDFNALVEQRIMQKEGQEDFESALSQKRQLERDRATFAENEYSKEKQAYRKKEKYRRAVPKAYSKTRGLSLRTQKDDDDLFEELKKNTPQFTKEGYEIYEKYKNAFNFIKNPQYREIYERAKKNYKNTQSGEFTREATNLLRPVNFDKDFKPISEEDKKNHEFNLKVLRAFEKDDLETIEKIIAEELPHFMDHVELPTLITKEDILAWKNETDAKKSKAMRNTLKARLDQWVEDHLKNGNAAADADLQIKSATVGSLEKLHPGVKIFKEDNPGFTQKWDTFDSLQNYISAFLKVKYRFRLDHGVAMEKTSEKTAQQLKNNDRDNDDLRDSLFEYVMEKMLIVYEHENDETEPYKTDEKIQQEIDKRNQKALDEKKAK